MTSAVLETASQTGPAPYGGFDKMPNCPFGDEKNSGVGRYNGHWAIEEFTTAHWFSVQHAPCPYPF
jgi:acyl-CoA reductase-like NAD-dependent aldehyde dehydrogenase